TARERGFAVNDEDLQKQLKFIAAFLAGNQENYRQGKGQGGQADTAGYALFALELGGWKADATTEAADGTPLRFTKAKGRWRGAGGRPANGGRRRPATSRRPTWRCGPCAGGPRPLRRSAPRNGPQRPAAGCSRRPPGTRKIGYFACGRCGRPGRTRRT